MLEISNALARPLVWLELHRLKTLTFTPAHQLHVISCCR
jgi:hypothetical protein